MANKRQAKKAINRLANDLLAECVSIMHYQKPTSQEDVDNIMLAILSMEDEMIRRINHIEPGISAHKYFQKIKIDITNDIHEIVDDINALL